MKHFWRYLLIVVVILIAAVLFAAWWLIERPLPQVDGSVRVAGLSREVTIDRDAWGVPHIRAGSLEDLLMAQGYVLAQDRLWQMDLLRRAAGGELAEIFGPAALDSDKTFRTLGLREAAERDAANLDPGMRRMLEAYARGVNRYLEQQRSRLPWEFTVLHYEPRPWRPADSLLIAGYMYRTLTASWDSELDRARVTAIVGPDRAADLYPVESWRDHFIVGGAEPTPNGPNRRAFQKTVRRARARTPHPVLPGALEKRELWKQAEALIGLYGEQIREGLGSNNWVVNGAHTASGKPILANDTHLPLTVPCIWYIIHLTAPGWNVKGFALPGGPLVVIGHNDRIAWGFTNNGADVADLYDETFNPANSLEYRVNGRWVAAQVRKEVIHVRGQADTALDVVVTRHGPIVEREDGHAYALRWTATEPGALSHTYNLMGRARNWDEFRDSLREVAGPAQNAVYADVDGNIGFIVAARIPIRRRGDASVPVPGDTDDYEWTGYIPFDELPQALNPVAGIIATANARVTGPGYKYFLTTRWAPAFRTERIYDLLEAKKDLRPVDCIAIQTDLVSLENVFLADQLTRAAKTVQPGDPRTAKLIRGLNGWNAKATADSVETSFVEFTRTALFQNLLRPYLEDKMPLYTWWRRRTFLENVLSHRPPKWLPKDYPTYDALLIASADQAVHRLADRTRQADPAAWRWGHLDQLEMLHPLGRSGLLRRLLSFGPMDQPGAPNSVKQTGRSFGPAMRFVADLADFDHSLMNITAGESGQLGSAYYRDQFALWFAGRGLPAPFSDAAEKETTEHHLRLLPAGER